MHFKIRYHQHKGASIIEYVIVIVVVLMAITAMFPYMRNVLTGQYRRSGESFGFLRQYDPKTTRECVQDNDGIWYSTRCFAHTKSKGACTEPCQGIR